MIHIRFASRVVYSTTLQAKLLPITPTGSAVRTDTSTLETTAIIRFAKSPDRATPRIIENEAEQWDIEIPYTDDKTESFAEEIKNPLSDSINGETINVIRDYLNDRGRTMVGEQVRDAKFAYWKGWADLLVPFLALAVAFLALFKDVIVAYMQNYR